MESYPDNHLCLRLARLSKPDLWSQKDAQYVFVFPKGGVGALNDQSATKVVAGDILVFSSAAATRFQITTENQMVFWHFSAQIEHILPLLGGDELSHLHNLANRLGTPRIYAADTSVASQCHKLLGEVEPRSDLAHRGQLLRVISIILAAEFNNLRASIKGLSPGDEHVIGIFEKLSISELLNLSVGELASRFSCSRRHLNRLFHYHFGLSVAALRMEMRLLKAATLLRDPSCKVINIAEECGFKHLGLFNTCFKRRFGMPPSMWRKSPDAPPDKPVSKPPCRLHTNGLCPWGLGTFPTAPQPAPGIARKAEPGRSRNPSSRNSKLRLAPSSQPPIASI